ncbi:MAG TPA: ABC transporter ATP-binding protein, partial [Methylocella sp.]|nr:ABC transporter ATP-binding protein [Methylocella sp.]
GLVIFEAAGPDLDAAARRLRRTPGVEAAAVFGHMLRASGTDRAGLAEALRKSGGTLSWTEAEPRLEDVFIHMLSAEAEA